MIPDLAEQERASAETAEHKPPRGKPSRSAWLGLGLAALGFLVFLVGIRPGLFGLPHSPSIGVVKISVFTLGLGMIALGGFLCLRAMWRGRPISIAADIGSRVVATGYVVAVFTGMADIFGFGSQPVAVGAPSFGEWQARGVEVGELLIALGFILMFRPPVSLFTPPASPSGPDEPGNDDQNPSR